jgi:signal transduction histidine kinase
MLKAALSFARDEASPETATRMDLAVLLQGICDDLKDAGKPVTCIGPGHLVCTGRPVELRRLFANLVDNALAYGREAAVALAADGDTAEVTVSDRGPGIPVAMREKVFAPFFRLEPSRNRETGGTGLGLTVARSITHRHGGTITLEDREGGGLVVKVRLPCAG